MPADISFKRLEEQQDEEAGVRPDESAEAEADTSDDKPVTFWKKVEVDCALLFLSVLVCVGLSLAFPTAALVYPPSPPPPTLPPPLPPAPPSTPFSLVEQLGHLREVPANVMQVALNHKVVIAGFLLSAVPATNILTAAIHVGLQGLDTAIKNFRVASKLSLPLTFSPNRFSFSLLCVSLLEDVGSIVLLNDDQHSTMWLYFWFAAFPVLDAIVGELCPPPS